MIDSSFFFMLCVFFVCVSAREQVNKIYNKKIIKESGAIHDYPIFISRASTPFGIKYGFSELLH